MTINNMTEVNYTPMLIEFRNDKNNKIGHLIVKEDGTLDFEGEATESAKEFVRLAKYWMERRDEVVNMVRGTE